jgi:hypothetical protein
MATQIDGEPREQDPGTILIQRHQSGTMLANSKRSKWRVFSSRENTFAPSTSQNNESSIAIPLKQSQTFSFGDSPSLSEGQITPPRSTYPIRGKKGSNDTGSLLEMSLDLWEDLQKDLDPF